MRLWCIGSTIQGDPWCYGHSIVAGTEHHMLPSNTNGSGSNYFRQRCGVCRSTKYTFERRDCRDKAAATRRYHARRMVAKGFAPTVDRALLQLDQAGVTIDWTAATFREALDRPCPGLCVEDRTGPDPLAPHLVTLADLEGDWRDPRYCITPENFGPLCKNCNRQKGETPWPAFIARQRAIRENIERSECSPVPPRQGVLDLCRVDCRTIVLQVASLAR
jgi:hypothetical protein